MGSNYSVVELTRIRRPVPQNIPRTEIIEARQHSDSSIIIWATFTEQVFNRGASTILPGRHVLIIIERHADDPFLSYDRSR
jgi:hypothetical protein